MNSDEDIDYERGASKQRTGSHSARVRDNDGNADRRYNLHDDSPSMHMSSLLRGTSVGSEGRESAFQNGHVAGLDQREDILGALVQIRSMLSSVE